MARPVELRQRAARDIDSALDHYARSGGAGVAVQFVDAVEHALRHISNHPLTGSLRYSYELDIPELRTWPLDKFPYIVFYLAGNDRVDVWRVLHAHRDLPASFAEPREPDATNG